MHPDTALEISLNGTAGRLAHTIDITAAVEELRAIAGGREDLVANALGSKVGGWVGDAGMSNPQQLVAAALLAHLAFDVDVFKEAFDDVRAAVEKPRYGTTGF